MKKLLAIVLAAACVLSLGIVASAANETVIGAIDPDNIYGGSKPDGADYTINWFMDSDGYHFAKDSTVTPDQTIYFQIHPDDRSCEMLADKDIVKVKFDKGDDNAKMISKMSIVEKALANAHGGTRVEYLAIELKNDMTDGEYKLTPSVTFTSKQWIKVDRDYNFVDVSKEKPADTDGWAEPERR